MALRRSLPRALAWIPLLLALLGAAGTEGWAPQSPLSGTAALGAEGAEGAAATLQEGRLALADQPLPVGLAGWTAPSSRLAERGSGDGPTQLAERASRGATPPSHPPSHPLSAPVPRSQVGAPLPPWSSALPPPASASFVT